MTGNIITFSHESVVSNKENPRSFPCMDEDMAEHMSIVLIGSKDDNDMSSKNKKDLIKLGAMKGPLQIRPSVINPYAKALLKYNKEYNPDIDNDQIVSNEDNSNAGDRDQQNFEDRSVKKCSYKEVTEVDVTRIRGLIPLIIETDAPAYNIEKLTRSDVAEVRRKADAISDNDSSTNSREVDKVNAHANYILYIYI
jgi:hypothetical protein